VRLFEEELLSFLQELKKVKQRIRLTHRNIRFFFMLRVFNYIKRICSR